MASTNSNMLPLGSRLPTFNLPDTVSGELFSSSSLKEAKASVIMFICNHCPYVKHVNRQLVLMANDYASKGVRFIAISSNEITNYPEDAPDKMKATAAALGYPFPYLYDESQQTARDFKAACTPDFYVFDSTQQLRYRGQLDDSRPSLELPVTGKDIRKALDNILAGKPVDEFQRPSIGCGIKWKQAVKV